MNYGLYTIQFGYKGSSLNNPFGICFDPVNSKILVANQGAGTISVFDLGWNAITTVNIGFAPAGIVYNSYNDVYIVSGNSLNVVSVNASTYAVTTVISTFTNNGRGMAIDYTNNRLLICGYSVDTVHIRDATTYAAIDIISISSPSDLLLDLAGDRLYIVRRLALAIAVYEYSTLTLLTTITGLSTEPYGIEEIDGKLIVTHIIAAGSMTIINKSDYSTFGVVRGFNVPRLPIVEDGLIYIPTASNKIVTLEKPF